MAANSFKVGCIRIMTLVACGLLMASAMPAQGIPLAEHPRPDFQRAQWQNLNGNWQFRFDPHNQGLEQSWFAAGTEYPLTISVPFPWGSKLSGVEDKADIGWYARSVTIPTAWQGQRVFVVIGACDWHTTAWLDGTKLGEHQGGYTPFEFDLTDQVKPGKTHQLVLRVDDTPHAFKLEGKQGYGRAAGIWQTVYLEARPAVALDSVHFTPDIDKKKIGVTVTLDQPATEAMTFKLEFKNGIKAVTKKVGKGVQTLTFDVRLTRPRLWSLDDPYLYEVTANLTGNLTGKTTGQDTVSTYFGMRKISVGKLPGTDYPYVMLNDKPLYMELTLDQAYHPEGFYTFPSDDFMRAEIQRTKDIGLNGQRIHIKVEVPRKLYWADKLGVLIMADVPNSWGQPDEKMQAESEKALRGMIKRDYNHPAIFSWVNFNETWGLFTTKGGRREYTKATQDWVETIYTLTKQLDPTRLVEDNSPCNYDHVDTDLNSWHAYLPGYGWREFLDNVCKETYAGSPWNYVAGKVQDHDPMFNSECGNVWGYEGSAGDGDWSWDYHIMINEFRRHPKVCGWLYTEHHDVINEWNGYWRFDRTEKETGLSAIVEGMTLKDFHSPFYMAMTRELCTTVKPGQRVDVPLYASFMTDQAIDGNLTLDMSLSGWNTLGQKETWWHGSRQVPYRPWMNETLEPLSVKMPQQSALAVLSVTLKTKRGDVLHRNFTTYQVTDGASPRQETIKSGKSGDKTQRIVRFDAKDFTEAKWSQKQWNVLDGLKVNGAGSGYFEYRIAWPQDLAPDSIDQATLTLEVSAKKLFGKDQDGAAKQDGDFMRGKGTHDPSLNRNAYPMTDETRFPCRVTISLGAQNAGVFDLANDSADHRGILSWHSQRRDRLLREAGSYGELITVTFPAAALKKASKDKTLVIRLSVDETLPGGLAIYGERFGRYPLDPTLVFTLKNQ